MPKVTVEYTVRVKPEHKPRKFNNNLGEGVLVVETVDMNIAEKYFPNMAKVMIYEEGQDILRKYIEVTYKIVEQEEEWLKKVGE